jgi:hypothetical protein
MKDSVAGAIGCAFRRRAAALSAFHNCINGHRIVKNQYAIAFPSRESKRKKDIWR